MEEKVFKTLDNLVDLLEERGIDMPDDTSREYAKRVLEKHGYYNLINGYNKLFLEKIVILFNIVQAQLCLK